MDFLSRLRNSIRQTQQAIQEQDNRNAEAAEERAVNNREGSNDSDSQTSRSFVISGNTSSAGSSNRVRVMAARSPPRQADSGDNNREAPEAASADRDDAPTIAQIFINRLAQNQRSQRIRAAFLRSLTSGRESTFQQFQNMRRLIRLGRNRESGSDSDRFYFEDRSDSSDDDIDSFNMMMRKCEELENDNPDSTPDKILVDEKFLMKNLHLSKSVPKQWIRKIIVNEIDQESSVKICSEFGALGLLLYSSLRNLTFFDLEKKMLDSATARASSTASSREIREIQPQPLDFIRPVMLFYLNTIMEFCIHDPEEALADIENILDDSSNFANLIGEEYSQIYITPPKDNEQFREDLFFKGFSAGTASTAASDSICAPSLDNTTKKNSDEKLEQQPIVETKPKLVKHSIPRGQRFTLMNLQSFMEVAPKINQIRKGIMTMKRKEVIIYKILLDMVGSYIRNFKTTCSKVYQEKYIPAVLEFYNKVDPEDLGEVLKMISDSLTSYECREMNVNEEIVQLLYVDVLQMPRNAAQREKILQGGEECKEFYLWLYRKQQMEGRLMKEEEFHLKEFAPVKVGKASKRAKKVKFE